MSDKNEQQNEPAEAPKDEQPKDDSEQQQPADEQPEDKSKEGSDDEENPEDEGSEDEGKNDEDEGDEELDLDRAKEKIAKANAEAKNLRTRLRDAEEKLKNAKTPEEVDEIVKQLQADRETGELDLLRENVALKFKLPEKLQKRLSGKTREELEADAKELAELFGTEDEDDEDINLEGGLNPRGRGDESSDPRSLAKKYGSRRRR